MIEDLESSNRSHTRNISSARVPLPGPSSTTCRGVDLPGDWVHSWMIHKAMSWKQVQKFINFSFIWEGKNISFYTHTFWLALGAWISSVCTEDVKPHGLCTVDLVSTDSCGVLWKEPVGQEIAPRTMEVNWTHMNTHISFCTIWILYILFSNQPIVWTCFFTDSNISFLTSLS